MVLFGIIASIINNALYIDGNDNSDDESCK